MPSNQNHGTSSDSPQRGSPDHLPVVSDTIPAVGGGLPAVVGPWMSPSSTNEGFDLVAYIHSVRRKWLLATSMGVLAAIVSVIVFWLLIPVNFEAVALLRVNREELSLGSFSQTAQDRLRDYETYKQTQAALIRSPYLVNAALREPGISQLPMVKDEENPVAWFINELRVIYPQNSEILMLSMKGEDNRQVIQLVDAVVDAYMNEVVYAERDRQVEHLNLLRKTYRKNLAEIKKSADANRELASAFGTIEDPVVVATQEMTEAKLKEMNREVNRVKSQVADVELELRLAIIRREQEFDPPKVAVEAELERHPRYMQAKLELDALRREYLAVAGTGQSQVILSHMRILNTTLSQMREELKDRAEYMVKRQHGRNEQLDNDTVSILQNQLALSQQRQNIVFEESSKLEQELLESFVYNSDLESRQAQLLQLQGVTDTIGVDIQGLELNLSRPPRVVKIQSAMIPDASDLRIKIMMITGLAIMSFFGMLFGIAFIDYTAKRVNVPGDLSQRTGVRVVGSVPLLTGGAGSFWPFRRLQGSSLESVLAESIDSIRTTLLCNTSEKKIDVVMVTSANSQEGKTTLAAQLAISLARSGRRTLLIDADMHNPQQHLVFGVPFGQGFCELLRGEANLGSITQAVSDQGLWFMSAGYCDQASLRAMADDTLDKIFTEIKADYDFIVIDTGPVLTGADPMLLGQHADATIVSVRRDISRLPKIMEAYERLQSVGIHIMGAVVNGAGTDVRRTRLELAQGPDAKPNDD